MLLPCLCAFLDTTLPFLFKHKSFLVNPPLVYTLVPFHTRRILPVWDLLVTRFGLRAFLAALGAFGFDARRTAFFAALRVARRAARLAARGLVALRATVLTAMVLLKELG